MATPPPFELRISYASDILMIEAVGEIDMANAPALGEAIESATASTARVVVDLSEVTFLDSSALAVLVHSRRALAERSISFRIVSPVDRVVRRVFEITRLTDELGVTDSLVEATAT